MGFLNVLPSNYNTSFGDLVPVIVANAIHLNVIILMKSGMNFTVHGICIDQSVNSGVTWGKTAPRGKTALCPLARITNFKSIYSEGIQTYHTAINGI